MVSPTYIVFQGLAFVPELVGQMGRVTKVTLVIAKVTLVIAKVSYYGHSTSNLIISNIIVTLAKLLCQR